MTTFARTFPTLSAGLLCGLLAGVSWHTVTLPVDTFHGLARAL